MKSFRVVLGNMIHKFVAVTLTMAACAKDQPIPEIEIHATPVTAEPQGSKAQEIFRLDALLKKDPARRQLLADLTEIIKAQSFEEREDWRQARQAWLNAMTKSTGLFAEAAFKRWVRAHAKALDLKFDKVVLASLLLTETDNGQKSEYMRTQGLADPIKLQSMLQNFTELDVDLRPILREEQAPFIPGGPIPSEEDPQLLKTSQSYCLAKDDQRHIWKPWVDRLNSGMKRFWQARVAECSGDLAQALALYNSASLKLGRSRKSASMGVVAAERVVDLYKQLGLREEMPNAYIQLMRAFEKPGVTGKNYGEDDITFKIRHANAALYAARYRALVADYINAKSYVQDGVDILNLLTKQQAELLNRSHRKQIMELRADAHHILAFRIALEQGDLNAAKSLSRAALEIPDLSPEWKERFAWNHALYDYKAGNFKDAAADWQNMITSKTDEVREKSYFWAARALEKMGDRLQAQNNLNKLREEFPLGFYSVSGVPLAGMEDGETEWHADFQAASAMEKTIADADNYGLGSFRSERESARLLLRAELMVAARAGEWASLAVKELLRSSRKKFPMKNHIPPYVYMSRLLHEAGDYFGAIALSAEMAVVFPGFWKDYPEQILIYYPRPFADFFDSSARQYGMEKEVLYGISRQESGFRKDVKSPADAYGLMQLIVPTAERMIRLEGGETDNMPDRLRQPATNIKAGAAYLNLLTKRYSDKLPSVFAAYNAGEYVVDIWQTRRAQEDPLLWIEFIPFLETKTYVKKVWGNHHIYKYINGHSGQLEARLRKWQELTVQEIGKDPMM